MHKHNNYQNRGNSRHFNGGFHRGRNVVKLDRNLFIKKRSEATTPLEERVSKAQFSDYSLVDKVKRNIADHGYTKPTEIQEKAIPPILEGRDVIGIANTGTGKTAAFLVTLINKSYLDRNQRVLIMVPTRELAIQIKDEFIKFARGTDLEIVAVIGGASIKRQTHGLRHRPHFVVGTPGRIGDLIGRKELNLMQFQNIVLDEVDRMVDIGFLKEMKQIIALLPRIRQSLFFSATVGPKTHEILRSFVTDPVTVSVKQQETSGNVEQDIIEINGSRSKLDTLHDLLALPEFEKVMIFGRTKWGAEKLSKALSERGFRVAAIHGNKNQNQRQRALQGFKDNKIQALIATDVASRGLDIDDVTHVINYDAPESYDDYVHRIGRTGRAGKMGVALTFVE